MLVLEMTEKAIQIVALHMDQLSATVAFQVIVPVASRRVIDKLVARTCPVSKVIFADDIFLNQ
jgi:hypothetical protein